ncbi:MAG: PAC2 family protein [Candidatus Bathyarchaeia archaeon]
MNRNTWVIYHRRPELKSPVAIAGSPGLRSIGELVIDHLIEKLKPDLFAELYSAFFPVVYHTRPPYAPDPRLPGDGGVMVKLGGVGLPRVQFYSSMSPELIITRGYHADFKGQYEVAEKVLDVYEEFGVERMIVIAGYGLRGREVCCAATKPEIIEEMKERYGVEPDYEGPFYGFSGLVFGLAKPRGIEALCLFGRTKPEPEDPQKPDEDAAKTVLRWLTKMLNITP